MAQLFVVPPEAFDPIPRVHSAIVRMLPRPAASLEAHDAALFGRVVQAAFSQRRKMLRNTLRGLLGVDELERLGIASTARAEELAPSDFLRIANSLAAPG
jgi:16S rRNA (adenine1518-N6/adenine1519-N6)-dimethyltransferase